MMFLHRQLESALRRRLREAPAVVLLGPRQVGKTTLARSVAGDWPGGAIYLDLERPADRRRLDDADAYLRSQSARLIVLDEIHRYPALFEILRGIIDERRSSGARYGRFLLLGSAGIELMRQASESLAGRVAYLDLAPLSLAEVAPQGTTAEKLWLRGGFPESLLAKTNRLSLAWRRDFIRSYLERDVPMFAPRLPAQTVGRLWLMLAHQQGAVLNLSRLAASLGVSVPAVTRYLDLLVDLRLLRRLTSWSGNLGKRLVKAPKIFIADSGLVHGLLEIETLDDLLGHPVAGASYEGWVIENLIAAAGSRFQASFFRSHGGAEIDLVLERGGVPQIAVEVKRSSAPSPSTGFAQACEDLSISRRYLVYPGAEVFPVRHNTQALGLAQLAEKLAKEAKRSD
ncbi:MAG: ATP-binding protein [Betaproteobacteria bacterium]|nr:ATP-binding protein [Betaproteobacteria bacterium]